MDKYIPKLTVTSGSATNPAPIAAPDIKKIACNNFIFFIQFTVLNLSVS